MIMYTLRLKNIDTGITHLSYDYLNWSRADAERLLKERITATEKYPEDRIFDYIEVVEVEVTIEEIKG